MFNNKIDMPRVSSFTRSMVADFLLQNHLTDFEVPLVRKTEVSHCNNAWRLNNNGRIISRPHYTVINHTFLSFSRFEAGLGSRYLTWRVIGSSGQVKCSEFTSAMVERNGSCEISQNVADKTHGYIFKY